MAQIPVFMNTVGPYKNPTETYGYYEKLPFCKPKILKHRVETLGEVLEGNRLTSSGYDVHFMEEMKGEVVCDVTYTPEQVALFRHAIDRFYYFQLILDELPLWGFIGTTNGEPDTPEYYLYTHLSFLIEYNGDRVCLLLPLLFRSFLILNSPFPGPDCERECDRLKHP